MSLKVPLKLSDEIGKKIVSTSLKTILKVCKHSKAISKSAVNKAGHNSQFRRAGERVRPILGRCNNINKFKVKRREINFLFSPEHSSENPSDDIICLSKF